MEAKRALLAHLRVSFGPGSLTNTYASPAISSVLVRTGRLVDGALRRLTDTRNWRYHLRFPDALQPGNGGFEHTGMVRAMHAFSRAQHRRDPRHLLLLAADRRAARDSP